MSHSSHDYVSIILDEIALEGLDGITLQALWLRLSQRSGSCIHLDDSSKSYVWNLAKKLRDVEMFELSTPRKDLVIYDRFEFVDPETGTVVDPEVIPEDIYPYAPVEDIVHNIRGSSSTYHDQVNVTEIARTLTYEEANDRWGNKLTLVANQATRMYAIQGDNVDPNVELTLMQYCLLEKIGRSRQHGEVTIGKSSLQRIGIDPKSLFYVRKYLMLHKLITKQIFHLKNSSQNCSGSLLHLSRFYVLRRPKVLILTAKVIEILKGRVGHFAEYEEIRQIIGLYYSLKKLMKTAEFQKFIKCEMLPYRKVYPEANRSEWKLKAFDQEKTVRVLQLIKPDIDVEDIWSKEDGDDDEDSYSGYLDQTNLMIDKPILCQAYDFFEDAGPVGISQVELGVCFGQSKLEARNICRNLVKCGLVSMYFQDVGRQRVTRYVCKKFSKQGEMNVQYEKEKQKMFALLSLKNEPEASREDAGPQNTSLVDPGAKSGVDVKAERGKTPVKSTSSVIGRLPAVKSEIPGESIVTEVVEDSVESSITNKYTGFQDLMMDDLQHRKESMTFRLLKRANLIMECVKANKVIYDCKKLMQFISDEEEREGYNVKICKKSFLRLLSTLKKDGCVKTISITLRMKNKTRNLAFICEPSITKDDPVIQSAVEQAKVKFFVHQKATINTSSKKSAANKGAKDKKKDGTVKEEKEKLILIKSKTFGKKYGFRPKFIRMKILHRLLFYLIYGYEGDEGLQQQKCIDQMVLAGHDLSEEVIKELPTIYYPSLCWKTFIPPLPSHLGFPEGWTFMSDWLLRIPLSLFVQLYNITYAVPSLEEYLNHPIRQHYLVRSLPSKIRKYLFLGRRYIFNIHDVVCRLCFIGLLQFGPQRLKDKDQVFIYLNRKAIVLDTTTSRAGYHQVSDDIVYEQQRYIFASMGDVDKYWYDMWCICLKTQLGGRMCVTGNNITVEVLEAKEAMIEATQPRNPDEAPTLDVGYIPGDHRGAAGLDSAIFSHLKRNWNKSTLNTKPFGEKSETQATEVSNIRETKLKQVKERSHVFHQVTTGNPLKVGKVNKTYAKVSGLQRKRAILTTVQNLCKKKVEKAKHVVRKVLPKRTSRRPRPYYDEEDRKALAAMSKLRVDWTEVEDSLLLTCKVAGLYFFPNPKYLSMSFQAIREVLHSTIKESRNKTSRACQRRILYVMRNPATAHSVSLSLLDLKHDPTITQKFQGVIQRAKAVAKNKEQLEKLLRPAFAELVEILSKRTRTNSSPNIDHELKLCSVEELRSKYEIAFPHILEIKSRFHDVKNVDDINMAVLHTIIHSSFCCSADKTNFAYQLFKVYQQYPDSFLKASMNKFRADQMVTLKKIYSRTKYKSGNFLPISSCPYQLSMNYAYLFQTDYQFEIFQQAYSIMKSLNQQLPLCSEDEKVEIMTSDGGIAALITEYYSTGKITLHVGIPDQVIILDPVFAERKDTYEGILKRFSQLLEATYRDKMGMDIPFNPLVGCGKRKRQSDGVDRDNPIKRIKVDESCIGWNPSAESKDMAITESQSNETEEQEAAEPETVTAGTSDTCYIRKTKWINKENRTDEIGGDNTKDSSAPNDENQIENKLLANNAACAASRIALYLMRKELTDSPLINSHHAHDFFVVNACDIYCGATDLKFISESYEKQLKLSEDVVENIKSSLILPNNYTSLMDLQKIYVEKGALKSDWRHVCQIINYVGHAKEVGITVEELRENYGTQVGSFPLSWHLKVLAQERVFIRVGVTCVRYVHYEYVTPWIVHSSKLYRLQRENVVPTDIKVMDLNKGTKSPKKTILEMEQEEEKEISEASSLSSAKQGESMSSNEGVSVSANVGESEDPKGEKECTKQMSSSKSESTSSGHEENPLSPPSAKKVKLPKSVDRNEKSLTNENSLEWNSPENKIKVFIRPWVRVDGSLNRRVLDRFLGSILGHTLQNPGICLKDLSNRFIPALQPYHTRELVEILRDLQCVKLCALKMKKPTLFSKPSKVEVVALDGTEDDSSILVSPLINAVSNLGIYLGEKKYSVDFLGNIL